MLIFASYLDLAEMLCLSQPLFPLAKQIIDEICIIVFDASILSPRSSFSNVLVMSHLEIHEMKQFLYHMFHQTLWNYLA